MRSPLATGCAFLLALAAWALQACGDDAPSAGVASGAAGAAGTAGTASQAGKAGKAGKGGQSGTGGAGGGDCAAPPRPDFVPESWKLHQYSCDCHFYSTGARPKELPGPQWGPCDGVLKFEAGVCELDKTSTVLGQPADPLGTGVLWGSLQVRETSTRWLEQMVWSLDFPGHMSQLHIVRDTDGAVRNGLYFPENPRCRAMLASLSDGIHSCNVTRLPDGPNTEGRDGIVAVRVDEEEPFAIVDADLPSYQTEMHHMKSGWINTAGIAKMVPWGGGAPVTVIDPAKIPYGAAFHFKLSQDDRAIFSLQETNRGFGSWTPTDGQRVLLQWDNPLKGALRLGTDFEQMVWTYGEGPDAESQHFSSWDVYTAPFTLDQAVLAKTQKRLREDTDGYAGLGAYALGCGYAARTGAIVTGASKTDAFLWIVRLFDGVAWKVKSTPAQGFTVRGVTCEHVYGYDQSFRPFRVRLDSLGPGLPPD